MRSSTSSAFSYRVHRPSRLRTPRPPSWPSLIAVAGETTPSIAEASSGSSSRCGPSRQAMSTSSASRVRRLGTIAMSSNPYARRAFLPRPISISNTHDPLQKHTRPLRAGRGKPPVSSNAQRSPHSINQVGGSSSRNDASGGANGGAGDLLHLDHGGEARDVTRVEHPGADHLGVGGAAGEPVPQALLRALSGLVGREEPGQ